MIDYIEDNGLKVINECHIENEDEGFISYMKICSNYIDMVTVKKMDINNPIYMEIYDECIGLSIENAKEIIEVLTSMVEYLEQ